MLNLIWQELQAWRQAHRFVPLLNGTLVQLSDGQSIDVRISRITRSERGSASGAFSFKTRMEAGSFHAYGFGEAKSRQLALQKSIAEAFERVVFKAATEKLPGPRSTNGWAAHVNEAAAKECALFEALERDAVLVHWLCKRPMLELEVNTLPTQLKAGLLKVLSGRYERLRILVADAGRFPAVVVLRQDPNGFAAIAHASGRTLNDSIQRAADECARVAHLVELPDVIEVSRAFLDSKEVQASALPECHAALYAQHLPVPEWMTGSKITFVEAQSIWRAALKELRASSEGFGFHVATRFPLVVGYASSPKLQKLYFGQTHEAAQKGWLNIERLRSVMPTGEFNPLPHCVP